MLKRHLKTSRGDLSRCFVEIDDLLTVHFEKVIRSFQKSIDRVEVSSNIPLFSKLRGLVSLNALQYMAKELERSQDGVGHDKQKCGCKQRRVFKLPCACEIGVYFISGSAIPLDAVDDHWKQLSLDVFDDKASTQPSTSGLDISIEMEGIWARYAKMNDDEKYVLKKALRELAFPSTSSMVPPKHRVKTKGAPKKKKSKFFDAERDPSGWEYTDEKEKLTEDLGTSIVKSSQRSSKKSSQPSSKKASQPSSKVSQGALRKLSQTATTKVNIVHIPPHMQTYVEQIIDVRGDGNCGFRAIAVGLDKGEDGWPVIRQDLIRESLRETVYLPIYGKNTLLKIRKAFTIEKEGAQGKQKWLDLPDMGFFIATKFDIVFVQLSLSMNFTYLPLTGSYRPSKDKVVAIVNKNGDHWMYVSMRSPFPLPPVHPSWQYYHSPEASTWIDPYVGRLSLWQSLCPPLPPPPPQTSPPIVVDLADDSDDV